MRHLDFIIILVISHLSLSFILKGSSFIYSYDPKGKVDPFMPIRIMPKTEKAINRLQAYSVSEFRLIGTLMGSTVTALLMTPESEGISVKIGDRVGRNQGRVIAIARDKLIVREVIRNQYSPLEGKRFQDVILELIKEEDNVSGRLDQEGNPQATSSDLREYQNNSQKKETDNLWQKTDPFGGQADQRVTNQKGGVHPVPYNQGASNLNRLLNK
jgi:hypothetical protein